MKDYVIRNKMLFILLLLAFFSIQSMASITTKSATFDEVQYYGIGKYLIKEHKWDIMGAILHPPLSYYLNSVPLLFVNEDKDIWKYDVKERNLEFLGAIDYYRGQELLSSPLNANDRLLICSRVMTLLLALLLGVYVYRFSSLMFGTAGGLISLFFFTFCPNILAYSGICVPDMPLTVFTLITIYYLWRCFNGSGRLGVIPAGFFLGLALLSKFTALLLIPIVLILTALIMFMQKLNLIPKLLLIYGIAALVLFAGYQFEVTPLIQGNQYRLMQQGYGQGVFLMGQYSNHGWWYFYPLTVLMKTPIPVLLLFPLAIYLLLKVKATNMSFLAFMLVPILVFSAVFIFSGYSVGLRYLLPVYPFAFVLLGAVSLASLKLRYFIGATAIWYVLSALYVSPHYLAYFNEAVGGPGNGYRYLVDSNLDWGQDLKGLKKFMDNNNINKISLSYFGADSPRRYGINYDWLPSHYLYNQEPDKPYDIYANQFVAISATNLQGVYLENRDMYKPLLEYEPIAKIGYSIFIYDMSGKGKHLKYSPGHV